MHPLCIIFLVTSKECIFVVAGWEESACLGIRKIKTLQKEEVDRCLFIFQVLVQVNL